MSPRPRDIEQPLTLRRKLRVPIAAAAVTAALAGGALLHKAVNSPSQSPEIALTKHKRPDKPNKNDKKELVKELETAYVGPIALMSAHNTGEIRTVVDGTGSKRAVVQVKIGGTAINQATADNHKTPEYFYTGLMEQVYNADDPSFGIMGITSQLNSEGEAEIYPRIDNFTGNTPATLRYVLGVGAGGYVGSIAKNQVVAAVYNAGEVDITGSNGQITSVKVVPPENGAAAPHIVEPAPGIPLTTYLR